MKNLFLVAPVFLGLIFASNAFSQEKCISGVKVPDKEKKSNVGAPPTLSASLASAKNSSPVTKAIFAQYNLENSRAKTETDCPTCQAALAKNPATIESISTALAGIPAAPNLAYNMECVKKANTLGTSTAQYACENGKAIRQNAMCMDESFLKYQTAVISSFLNCARVAGLTTVSPAALFKLYSLESTFKPQVSSGSGMGLGQVTGIFVNDLHQSWRGLPFLKKIATSDLKECEAAKVIAQKDVAKKPSTSNKCNFISVGEGLERNILYSLVGQSSSWKNNVAPKLHNFLTKNAGHPLLPEIKDEILLSSYGRGGPGAGVTLARRIAGLTPEQAVKRLKKTVSYVNQRGVTVVANEYNFEIKKKQDQLTEKLAEPLKSQFAKQGARACINRL